MPRLKELQLYNCPKLRSLLAGLSHAKSLESMTLSHLHEITEVNQLPRLTHLYVDDCPSLERISHLPRLQKLKISRCPELKDVPHLDALCFLFLKIDDIEKDLPAWLLGLAAANRHQMPEAHSSSTALPVLYLECGLYLFLRCAVGGEYWPIIQQFPEVTINSKSSGGSLAYTRMSGTVIVGLPVPDTESSGDD